ncbi:MAG: hypothetical protein ACI8PZ_002113 [Myxococcota bacterium]|jgi:hypothetical protein
MLASVTWGWEESSPWLSSAMYRYDLLSRLGRCAERQGASLLAFGFSGPQVRFVVEAADAQSVTNLLRGLRIGTGRAARSWNMPLGRPYSEWSAFGEGQLLPRVVWAHRGPLTEGAESALASPWSSHRDLMGLREMSSFDPSALVARVDPAIVHARVGGRALPELRPQLAERPDLFSILRVAAGIRGVLPADRKCYRLFVHLARYAGWSTDAIAEMLDRTRRRVRQLHAEGEPLRAIGVVCLADPRLSCVP